MKLGLINRDLAQKRAFFRSTKINAGMRHSRLYLVGMIALLWSGLLVARLYSLQISDFEKWREWALRQHSTEIELAAERGSVLDRNGKLLAVSVPAGSVYVRPKAVKDKELASRTVADILKLPLSEVRARFNEPKPFVWIKRQVPRAVAQQVSDARLDGVGFILEARRFYPYNEAASTVIGKVGLDGHGLSGIEQTFESHLSGGRVTSRFTRDALGNMIEIPRETLPTAELPKGNPITLTIDAGLQIILDQELEAGRQSANAKAAMAALVDSETGEILAMSQAPAFNFNTAVVKSKNELTNKLVETVFEPGSILKPIVAAAAFDAGLSRPGELVNCEGGRYRVGSHVVKDVHPNNVISVRDVLIRSSNIGMTKLGMRLGRDRLFASLHDFGFGELSGLGLPGETAGILRSPEDWALIDVATHSFGQGVAVTPLQMLRAVSAIANGGKLPSLHLVKQANEYQFRRVVSESSAEQVRSLMYGVVEDVHGTGNKAAITGVRVGGKTGTAQKPNPNGRGYLASAYMASFIGFVDGRSVGVQRTLTLMVVIDEPKTTSIYGGTLAAPVFRKAMQRSLHFMGMRDELHTEVVPQLPQQRVSELTPVSFVQ